MPVRLLLELLVHQDYMDVVTAVEAVVVFLFQVAMAVVVGTVESAAGAVAVVHPEVKQAVSMVALEGQAVWREAVVVPVE